MSNKPQRDVDLTPHLLYVAGADAVRIQPLLPEQRDLIAKNGDKFREFVAGRIHDLVQEFCAQIA